MSGQWIRVHRATSAALAWLTAPPAPILDAIVPGHLNGWGPVARHFDRSQFVRRLAAMDAAAASQAARATLGLLLASPGPSRTRSLPPLWGPLLAAMISGTSPVYIPRPHPRYDPLTWTLLGRLCEQWETEGLTFVGANRRQLYLRAGTRRMARTYRVSRRRALACGRTASRIWRHWYETSEGPREARVREFPVPSDIRRTLEDPARVYRAIRHARNTGQPTPYTHLVPKTLVRVFLADADRSIASFPKPPASGAWPKDPVPFLAWALQGSPLAAAARRLDLKHDEIHALAGALAGGLLRVLTAPWPWGQLRCPS